MYRAIVIVRLVAGNVRHVKMKSISGASTVARSESDHRQLSTEPQRCTHGARRGRR
jgi:hypothetical protein